MKNKNFFDSNHGKFDSINSTYKHEIYLSNGKILTGYSKGLNLPELHDKDTLVQRVIRRLYGNGYLHKKSEGTAKETLYIHFYLNQAADDEWFLTLLPLDYQLSPEWINNEILVSFLKRFYEQVRSGVERKNLVKEPRQRDLLSLNQKFSSTNELLDYCNQLEHKYGLPHGIVQNFYREYCKNHFNK